MTTSLEWGGRHRPTDEDAGTVTTVRRYTAADLWTMPGDEPWELWDGELRKAPGSGIEASRIAANVVFSLKLFLRGTDVGVVTSSDGSFIILRDADHDTVVVPDVAFIRWDRLPEGRTTRGYSPVPPDLAVEVQSPSDEPADMATKRGLYARAHVPLLWWIDPAARTVTVYTPDQPPRTLTEADTLDGADVLPGLSLPVADIFA